LARQSSLIHDHTTIETMLAAGVSKRQIAKELGVARSTLTDYIRNHIAVDRDVKHDGLATHVADGFTEIPVIERFYGDEGEHYVYPLGDVHIGSPAFAADRFGEWIEYLTDRQDASMLGTGDFLNSAIKTSVSETYDEVFTVGQAKRQLRDLLEPLANTGRIDLLMPGNHEDRIYRSVGDCPIQDVSDFLETPYCRVACIVIYHVGSQRYEFAVRHGTGGGMIGARAGRLARQAQTVLADVYVSGHTHSQLVFPQELFVVDGNQVKRRRQYFVSSGSFLAYEEYAARQGFAPQKIGAPRIRLDGERHDVHVSI